MNEDLVVIDHVSKSFSEDSPPALQDITATIPKGELVGLVGPDGAGKTTLIRLIAGLLLPTEGTITVSGYDTVTQAEEIHRITSYMPQKFGLYEDLSVIQNLNLYADLRNVRSDERQATFEQLFHFTNLKPFKDRLAGALSGGMKQKLGLACSLIKKPTLLLLDEPSVGVDPISRRELWQMVYDLLDDGISVLWSTAYLDEAERCKKVLLLNEGKLLYHGSPQEFTKRVEGRVYKISQIEGNHRSLLEKTQLEPNIVDSVVQGQDVRIVTKEFGIEKIDPNSLHVGNNLKIDLATPRFEDAFIDVLGGGPKGSSQLAEKSPNISAQEEGIIDAQGLTKKFGDFTAADNITFKIKKGEIFGLLGPNGAGKSTTFKMLCGLLKPTSGKAYINGKDLLATPAEARSHIGYMAQKFSLYGNLSVGQNLEFFSGIYNLRGKQQREAVNQMIEIFNLKHYLDTSADELPLGFKQRLALSCASMHHPEVLFLDEPTSGVDPITRREFWSHINGLVQKGVTVMVTTHFMDEAEYCDRIALVYRSKVIQIGTTDELKQMAITDENQNPSLEDAFIKLVQDYDAKNLQ